MKAKTMILLALMIAFSTSSIHAKAESVAKSLDFVCATERFTTTFAGKTNGDQFQVKLINHNGVLNMPIYNGNISSADLPVITKRSEVLSHLGNGFTFTFPVGACTLYGDGIFSCYGSFKFVADGQEFKVLSLISSRTTTEFQGIQYQRREIMVGLDVNNKIASISMSYNPDECEIEGR